FLFDETGLKPFPVARQALAAVEACRLLAGRSAKEISAITISVPAAQARVIDHPGWPSNRLQAIARGQDPATFAPVSPEQLMNINGTPPFETRALRTLAAKVRVRTDSRLDGRYPDVWPARVVVDRNGKRKSTLVTNPRGDAGHPLGWEDVLLKAAPFR